MPRPTACSALHWNSSCPWCCSQKAAAGARAIPTCPVVAGLHVGTFTAFARLSGQVPVLGIAAGRCFAGNAALLGCCDVIIATRQSNIGMGGPAMVEGGGLGVFRAEDIGPASVQHGNGVIDVLVDDEAGAVQVARQYLGYFQGCSQDWVAPDPLSLREVVPENRLRVYDARDVMTGLVDQGSLLPLRTGFRRGHPHRTGAHRGPRGGADGQQPAASGRCDRRRRCRQGRTLHAAV